MTRQLQRAAAKIKQTLVHLRLAHSGSKRTCGNCVMWRSRDNCTLVSGYVAGDRDNGQHIELFTVCDRQRMK